MKRVKFRRQAELKDVELARTSPSCGSVFLCRGGETPPDREPAIQEKAIAEAKALAEAE